MRQVFTFLVQGQWRVSVVALTEEEGREILRVFYEAHGKSLVCDLVTAGMSKTAEPSVKILVGSGRRRIMLPPEEA
jgi:hypothetical protein